MTVPKPFDTNDPTGQLDHSDRGPLFVAMSWLLTGFGGIFLALRVYCKLWTRRRLWWDDWILIGAFVKLQFISVATFMTECMLSRLC